MNIETIQSYLRYWGASREGVEVHEIKSVADVTEARKWCSVMRAGLFAVENVTDQQIWDALVDLRKADLTDMQRKLFGEAA